MRETRHWNLDKSSFEDPSLDYKAANTLLTYFNKSFVFDKRNDCGVNTDQAIRSNI